MAMAMAVPAMALALARLVNRTRIPARRSRRPSAAPCLRFQGASRWFGAPSSIRNVREGPTGRAVWPEASGRIAGVGSCVRGARDGVFYVKSQGNLPLTDTMKTRFGLESP